MMRTPITKLITAAIILCLSSVQAGQLPTPDEGDVRFTGTSFTVDEAAVAANPGTTVITDSDTSGWTVYGGQASDLTINTVQAVAPLDEALEFTDTTSSS